MPQPYEKLAYRLQNRGLDIRTAIDNLEQGFYRRLTNVESEIVSDAIQPRRGTTLMSVKLPGPIHTL